MSRRLGELEVVKPNHLTREADSMDHATATAALLATHFATSLFPLTVRLIPVTAQIGRLIVQFRRADVTPQTCYRFETQLQAQLRELGRIVVEWTFNHLEPHDRRYLPGGWAVEPQASAVNSHGCPHPHGEPVPRRPHQRLRFPSTLVVPCKASSAS